MDPTPDNIAYLYDGSVEGLFTAVFLTYANKEHPLDICPSEHYQPRIGQTARQIETCPSRSKGCEQARRV